MNSTRQQLKKQISMPNDVNFRQIDMLCMNYGKKKVFEGQSIEWKGHAYSGKRALYFWIEQLYLKKGSVWSGLMKKGPSGA